MPKYACVKIPKNLAEEVDRLIGKLGFTSRAEIVKDALRRALLVYHGLEKELEDKP